MDSSAAERVGKHAALKLARTGQYDIGPGLTRAEFARIERDYGIEFADDHRAFLAEGLPLNGPQGQVRPGSGPGPTGATAIPPSFGASSGGPPRE